MFSFVSSDNLPLFIIAVGFILAGVGLLAAAAFQSIAHSEPSEE